jgi:predicted DNA-binding transcriptional regulator AlpA
MPSEEVQALVGLLYSEANVCRLLNTDRRGLWILVRTQHFPPPTIIRAGRKRLTCWLREEVADWLAEHPPPAPAARAAGDSRPRLQRPSQ